MTVDNVKQDNVVSVSCTSFSVHVSSLVEIVGKANEKVSAMRSHFVYIREIPTCAVRTQYNMISHVHVRWLEHIGPGTVAQSNWECDRMAALCKLHTNLHNTH